MASGTASVRTFQSLRGSGRFDDLFRNGVRVRHQGVTVVKLDREPGPARVGLVVGRRVGGAVMRNRVKRRLREALRRVGVAPGADYAVIASDKLAQARFSAVCDWIETALDEAETAMEMKK